MTPGETSAGGPAPVGFLTHAWLLWRLRLTVAGNRFRAFTGATAVVAGTALLLGVSLSAGYGAWALLAHPAVAGSQRWSDFLLRLACFLVTAVFVTWPVLSAGVDEHSEISRFATFPIRPRRLFAASAIAGLVEPRALAFYPAIIGAAVGYAAHRPLPLGSGAALIAAYFALNVAWGRAALTLVLNVLRHRRSAELLGVSFLAVLFLASLAPPVDVSWIYALLQGGPDASAALDERTIVVASEALAHTPPGTLAVGLASAARGRPAAVAGCLAALLLWAAVGFGLAYWLLVRFYRGTARPAPPARERAASSGGTAGGTMRALVEREASDWLRNPKARLLCAVPFFLCILLRLVNAHDLACAFLGGATDAWLLAVLCAYAGLVVGPNFAQNLFAYDGPGLALLFAAPVPLRRIFVAKNLVHGGGALAVGLLLSGFYAVYVHRPPLTAALFGLLALAGQLPALLALGNFLSVLAPRKFHASLRRRDRPPALTTVLGLGGAALALAPMTLLLRALGRDAPSPGALVALAAVAAVSWAAWAGLLPCACALLDRRRAHVLRMVTRE